jgi:hypothetical protein
MLNVGLNLPSQSTIIQMLIRIIIEQISPENPNYLFDFKLKKLG